MEADDFAVALALQNKLYNDIPFVQQITKNIAQSSSQKTKSLTDPVWELIDPTPDIYVLFDQFNKQFFWNTLSMVEVRWSPRMTLCAGLCCYEGRGMLCSIRLSQPLLKLRPRKDLVETLLHEMIHAYLFVTENNKDRDGHGPEFCKHMHRINTVAGTNITIYHSFHDEVDEMRKHWWRCNGRCRGRPPYFGYVKRSMNRQPSKNDYWWADHEKSCGGTFLKIKEPDDYSKKVEKSKKASDSKTDSTQRTLSFSVIKPTNEQKGNVLGGKLLPRESSRGIPLTSRLLTLPNQSSKRSADSANKISHKNSRNGSQPEVFPNIIQLDGQKKSTNLKKVCQRLRRTGLFSVNENAPGFKRWKVKTKYFSTSKKIIFSSDDESETESYFVSSTTSRNPICDVASFQPNNKTNSGNSSKITCLTRDKNIDLFKNNLKRKNIQDVNDALLPSLCSPAKKKSCIIYSSPEKFEKDSSNPSTSALTDLNCVSKSLLTKNTENVTSIANQTKKISPISHGSLQDNMNQSVIDVDPGVSSVSQPISNNADIPETVSCPVCSMTVPYDDINTHIDICLSIKAIQESSF